MPEVIFVASYLTIIESIVVSSQFEKLIRDDKESVALVIKFLNGGVLSITSMNFKRGRFKNLRWNIGYYTVWTRHYLSVTST